MYTIPASIACWGQKAVYWDNPKPLAQGTVLCLDETIA